MTHQGTARARFLLSIFAGLLALSTRQTAQGQNAEPFKFFREYVGLNDGQIAAIRSGKALAKIVESRTPDEVFVFGAVYVESTPDKYLKFASDIDSLPRLASYLAIQKFSNPPQLSDLEGFSLEAEDIKDLKNCEPLRIVQAIVYRDTPHRLCERSRAPGHLSHHHEGFPAGRSYLLQGRYCPKSGSRQNALIAGES